MDATEPIASSSSSAAGLQEVAASKNGRTIGKAHKSARAPVRRSYISNAIKTPFTRRMEEEQKRQSIKATEKEMKDEKEADRQMKRDRLKERRDREAEKIRLEQLAAKMSAKKLQRMKKVSLWLLLHAIRADEPAPRADEEDKRVDMESSLISCTSSDLLCLVTLPATLLLTDQLGAMGPIVAALTIPEARLNQRLSDNAKFSPLDPPLLTDDATILSTKAGLTGTYIPTPTRIPRHFPLCFTPIVTATQQSSNFGISAINTTSPDMDSTLRQSHLPRSKTYTIPKSTDPLREDHDATQLRTASEMSQNPSAQKAADGLSQETYPSQTSAAAASRTTPTAKNKPFKVLKPESVLPRSSGTMWSDLPGGERLIAPAEADSAAPQRGNSKPRGRGRKRGKGKQTTGKTAGATGSTGQTSGKEGTARYSGLASNHASQTASGSARLGKQERGRGKRGRGASA